MRKIVGRPATIFFSVLLLSAIALLAMLGGCGGGSSSSSPPPPPPPATAQTKVQHVIMVIQENRTPTNLFHADQALISNGAHLVNSGSCHGTSIPLTALPLDTCADPAHVHSAWESMYDGGKMDGACDIPPQPNQGCVLPRCSDTQYQYCPQYSYVPNTKFDGVHGILDPYFQLAEQYGFANYMFQTNQGPSYAAHQFLFSGTAAPIAYPTPYYNWFADEHPGYITSELYGCIAPLNTYVAEVAPSGKQSQGYTPNHPPGANPGFPCYEHPTLPEVLEPAGISWRYYGWQEGGRWTAPNSIDHLCQSSGFGPAGHCEGAAFKNGEVQTTPAQVLTDLGVGGATSQSCQLPQVSWVIPDGSWSDHPGGESKDGGPSWVAAIVNAVGGYDNAGNKLPVQCNYWGSTVVLIAWDDWGGFYDDVNPITTIGGGNPGYVGGSGNGQQYVYGFRVPLIVVSPYAKQGYISGPASNPTCPNFYCHDFGSMLNFVEYAFGSNGNSLGTIGPPQWPYADAFAQDTSSAPNNYSLYDFFNWSQPPRAFVPITGAKYSTTCFLNPSTCMTGFSPSPPDSD
jgi:hypothetical protein